MSTLKVNDIVEATSGGGKIWPARAWVNFNGTGTVSIRADGNVSSVTDLGTGYYRPAFDNAFSDANYNQMGMSGSTTNSAAYEYILFQVIINTSNITLRTSAGSGSATDVHYIGAGFIR